jgi:endonuclease-3
LNKKERVQYILKELARRYPDPPIPLNHNDAFTLLVAVLLSAQCTDARVNEVTPALFALADTPEKMAALEVGAVKEIIKPCGLSNNKSKAIVALSQKLINEFDAVVPRTLEELESLPGVGHKTASVVMIQAFGQPAFPVDTHIHRLAKRWRLSSGKNVVQTEKDLKKAFPKDTWIKLHLQMIYYGREHCSARGCDGLKCPICSVVNQ